MSIDLHTYLAYVAACIAVVIVPGPSVTLIIANSLRHGARAGLMNVAGTQAGLAIVLAILTAGLATIVTYLGAVFDIVRVLGAIYLIWLGVKLWRSDGRLADLDDSSGKSRKSGFFWQGFLVVLSNPKVLLFFGAFIPQFIDRAGDPMLQTLLLGGTFIAVAALLDGAYAMAAGHAGALLSRGRLRIVERVSGSLLIMGGVWLALDRRS